MVEDRAILSDYPVEEVGAIKFLKELGELASGYKNDAAAGTTKRYKSLDCGIGDDAILCKRAVVVGSEVGKVHIFSDVAAAKYIGTKCDQPRDSHE
jgi:hypothetical protein